MNRFTDTNLTKYAENAKPSFLLPGIGLAMGLGNHLINRRDLSNEEKDHHLLRSLLLGGMAGTGAEMMRLGITNGLSRFGSSDQIPKGVSGIAIPDKTTAKELSGGKPGFWERTGNAWNAFWS